MRLIQQGGKLVGTGSAGRESQGASVAISADGNTAVIGASNDNLGAGAAWIFTRGNGVWSQQGNKLVGTGAVGAAHQGFSVAISADGNTAIVGGNTDDSRAGSAWVFARSGSVWSQQGPKLVGTGAIGGAQQGTSVAISADGSTAIVGGEGDNEYAGAAWVFTRTGGVWSQQGSKLTATDAAVSYQGHSVAISADGNTAIVGASGADDNAGAAWIFTRIGWMWSQQGDKLIGTGNAGRASQGTSVALSGDGNTALIGGPNDNSGGGAAWVFTRSNGVWAQQGDKLVGRNAAGALQQGFSVAISADGETAIIGGPFAVPDTCPSWSLCIGLGYGAAWVFSRSGGLWSEVDKLVGTGATASAGQGMSVAISADGNTALVGGPGDGDHGAAWVFSVPASTAWVPVVAHNPGLNQSEWRSDLGLLNPGVVTANVQIEFFGSGGVVSNATYVPAGTQWILTDVVGQLGVERPGSPRDPSPIGHSRSRRAPTTRSRRVRAVTPTARRGRTTRRWLRAMGCRRGRARTSPDLTENASYRATSGWSTLGPSRGDGTGGALRRGGTKLADYPVSLAAGEWKQEIQPFMSKAGQTAMDRGYAKITVQSGSGVFAFASVVDNLTNDPTTVTMQR